MYCNEKVDKKLLSCFGFKSVVDTVSGIKNFRNWTVDKESSSFLCFLGAGITQEDSSSIRFLFYWRKKYIVLHLNFIVLREKIKVFEWRLKYFKFALGTEDPIEMWEGALAQALYAYQAGGLPSEEKETPVKLELDLH